MDKNLAEVELMAMQVKALKLDDTDIFTVFINAGIPKEILARLNQLWDITIKVSSKVIQIGKIIIMKLIEFIKENPHLTLGLILGVYFGTVVELPIMEFIPDIAVKIFNTISFYALSSIGVIAGLMKDSADKQGIPNDSKNMVQGFLATVGDLIGAIKIFLEKFIDIIMSLKGVIKI